MTTNKKITTRTKSETDSASTSPNTILFGLDSATWNNLKPFILGGKLPFLAKIYRDGSTGVCKSTIPSLTPVAVPSLYTGSYPTKHGIFGFTDINSKIYNFRELNLKPFWNWLGRSLIVDLRTTYKPYISNGVMISDELCTPPNAKNFVYPKVLFDEWKDFHKNSSKAELLERQVKKNRDTLLKLYVDDIDRQSKTILKALKKNNFDFLLWWIGRLDNVQHFFWKEQSLIERFYVAFDNVLAKFIESRPSTNIVVVSDHGMENLPKYNFHVNDWLAKKGYLKKRGFASKISWLKNIILTIIPSKLLKILLRIGRQTHTSDHNNSETKGVYNKLGVDPSINWHKTSAYLDQLWGIRVLDTKILKRLQRELLTLIGPNNKKVFREVLMTRKVYPKGRFQKMLPQLLLVFNEDFQSTFKESGSLFTSNPQIDAQNHVAEHYNMRDGIFIAYGPAFAKKKNLRINIWDVAPTILHLNNKAIPSDMDGRVIKEIFRKSSGASKRKPLVINSKKEDSLFKNLKI